MLKLNLSQISKVDELNYHYTLKICTFFEKLFANSDSQFIKRKKILMLYYII